MSTTCTNRLMADLKTMTDDPPEGISGAPREDNIMLWDAVIFGYLYLIMSRSYSVLASKI